MSFSAKNIVAHRGFAAKYPENTLASVRAALKLGARYVEIDVQLTADYVPVVYHDPTLKRISGIQGDIRKHRFYELARLKPRYPITTLAALTQVFGPYPKAKLFVELKEESLLLFGRLEMLAAVDTALAGFRKRAILISFDREVLTLAKRITTYPLGFVVRRFSDVKSSFCKALKPAYIFSGLAMLPDRGSLRIKNTFHCVYEVPDPSLAAALQKRGADMIETFAIDNYLLEAK